MLWSALAAIGFDYFFDPEGRRTRLLRISAGVALVMVASLGAVFLLRGSLVDLIVRTGLARGRGVNAQAALSTVLCGGLAATAVAALVPLALWLLDHPRLGRFARPGFMVIVLAQLIAHDWSMNVLISRHLIRRIPSILEPLPRPFPGEFPRVLRRARDVTPVAYSDEVRAFYLHQLAIDNEATRFGFAQVPGYTIAGTARFEALAIASGNSNLERIMDLLDIRYLIIEASQAGNMGMSLRSPGALAGHVVLENEERRVRAFVSYRYQHELSDQQILKRLFVQDRSEVDFGAIHLAGKGENQTDAPEDPSPCIIERPVPEHVILHCRARRAGYAVLLDEWTQGWSATVDRIPTPLERADVIFRAAPIPEGDHLVEMRYRTPGLRIGAGVSAGGCLIFAVLALAWLRQRRRDRAAMAHAPGSSLAG